MSASPPSVKNIFDTMNYGAVGEGRSLAEAWLTENASQLGPFIDGKLSPSTDACVPIGLDLNLTIKVSYQQDSNKALSSATIASSNWGLFKGHARAKVLYNIARQLQKHSSLISQLESLSSGILLRDSREYNVPCLIRAFYYYAGWAKLTDSDFKDWEPLGVVADISSSGSSLLSVALIAAPALAAGNSVVLFPPVTNCLSALLLAQIFSAAGLLPGVFSVVPVDSVDAAHHPILAAKEVEKVAAVGSTHLVQSVLRQTSSLVSQDYALLLNGCVPMIVLESSDLDAVVDCAVDAAWCNQGLDPWALQLMIVEEAVMESLKKKLIARVKGLKLGGAFDKMADVSCSSLDSSLSKNLKELLQKDTSVEVVQPPNVAGEWVPTVIFSSAPPSPSVLTSVDVCPVVHVVGARSLKEAINIANHCGAGAATSVWTENIAEAWEAASLLRMGTIWINSHGISDASVPLCGRGLSGRGCFSGKEALMEYLHPRKLGDVSLERPLRLDTLEVTAARLPVSCPLPTGDSTIDLTYKLFYGGCHKRPDCNSHRTHCDAMGKPFAVIPEANRKDVRNAVETAVKAQPGWWKRGAHSRAQILFNLAEKLETRHNYFTRHLEAISLSYDRATEEVDESVSHLFHFAAVSDKFVQSHGSTVLSNQFVCVTREPYGVVAILAVSGSALADVLALIGAALAYGNTCIVIPRPDCPTPALELAMILEAAEVPAGVVNVLSGETNSLIPTICGHMEVDAVWCIGYELETLTQMKMEAAKSNLKSIWFQHRVISPANETARVIYERAASHCKAIWVPNLASFGN